MRDTALSDCCEHALADIERTIHVRVRQHHHEFVAAVSRGKVRRALQRLPDSLADSGKTVVAGAMSTQVVVGLEVVDIHEQHCQRPMISTSALPFRSAHDVEVAAVIEAGKRVDDSERK